MKIYAVNELIIDSTNGDSYSNTLKCFKTLDEAKSYIKDVRANELISDYFRYDDEDVDEDFDDDISEDEVDTDFDFDVEKFEYNRNDPTELYSYCMTFIDKEYNEVLTDIELKVQEIDYLE